jgi:hypothetical protein
MSIIKKYKSFLLKEMTEFNLQRMNPDSVQASVHVDNPQLSINAFDKHQDVIRQAISKLGTLNKALQNTNGYRALKSKLGLEDQDISNIKIIRITKSLGLSYDVYISFIIDSEEYWGVITNILSNPDLKSEVFKDQDLIQTKEWIIKIKGLIIKNVKSWMKPQFGKFKLINDQVDCYSSENGKMLILPKDSVIEVLKSYDDKIIFEYDNKQYTLRGDNFVYFNWWFEPIKD